MAFIGFDDLSGVTPYPSIYRTNVPGVKAIRLSVTADGGPVASAVLTSAGKTVGSGSGSTIVCDLSTVVGAVEITAVATLVAGGTERVARETKVVTPTAAQTQAYAAAAAPQPIGREVKVRLVPRAEFDQRTAAGTWPADGNLYLPEPA